MKRLEDVLGLHESIEVWYVVDGYVATLYTEDGGKVAVEGAVGATVLAAIALLEEAVAE